MADQLEARGWVKGREEGRRETLVALAAILRRNLEHKFGEIPDGLQARIAEADLKLLARWSMGVLDATCIGDVFGD